MRYFKPELLARYRSHDDSVAEAAALQWDRAIARYNQRLDNLRPFFPAGVRFVLDHFSLHDGRVLGIALAQREPRLSLLIRLESTPRRPGEKLELVYIVSLGT